MSNDLSESVVSRAQRLILAHRIEDAIDLVAQSVAHDPDNLDAWLFLAFYYTEFDYRLALEAWQQVARLRPGDTNAAEAIKSLSSYLQ